MWEELQCFKRLENSSPPPLQPSLSIYFHVNQALNLSTEALRALFSPFTSHTLLQVNYLKPDEADWMPLFVPFFIFLSYFSFLLSTSFWASGPPTEHTNRGVNGKVL